MTGGLQFTGERFTPGIGGEMDYEHFHRYCWAASLVAGRRVLDIACGEGYGSALLAATAREVVGMDISEQAVAHAREAYGQRANLRFEAGSATAIPLPDASVEVVVSFETLEHLAEQQRMLAEMRRVLHPEGFLVISSPNRKVYSDDRMYRNEYHVKELYRHELEALLGAFFPAVEYYGQRMATASFVVPLARPETTYEALRESAGQARAGTLPPGPVMYFLAACAARADLLPAGHASAFMRDELDLYATAEARLRWAAAIFEADQQAQQLIGRVERAAQRLPDSGTGSSGEIGAPPGELAAGLRSVADAVRAASALNAAASAGTGFLPAPEQVDGDGNGNSAAIRRLEQALQAAQARELEARAVADRLGASAGLLRESERLQAEAQQQLRHVLSSRSWRMTAPYRALGATLQVGARRAAGSLRRHLVPLSRSVYRLLPVSPRHKDRLVQWLFRHAGFLFRGVPRYENWRRLQTDLPRIRPRPRSSSGDWLQGLAFLAPEQPDVSVIIPAYGNLPYTANCLHSILENRPQASYEVIVAEDASGDADILRLREVPGLRFIEHPRNLGFLRSANAAATRARGRLLFFLNNDAEVTAGWLDSLVALMDREPECGVAGSRLVYPDGRLQEAGGIIWRDGSGWNFGRLDDPSRSIYNYVKDADYVSGAALMVPADLFRTLGGFDERYVPAYYEDTDLAFRVRALGRTVRYQPASVVIHHEGISHGTDLSSGIKSHQVQNQQVFRERWKDVLEAGHAGNGEQVFLARERSLGARVILVVDHYIPQPDRDAGSRSMMHLMRQFLAHGLRVKFWPQNLWYDAEYAQRLQQLGIEVYYGAEYDGRFGEFMREAGGCLDWVLLSRPQVASEAIAEVRRHSRARVLFYGHDIHYLRLQAELAVQPRPGLAREAARMRRLEEGLWRQADAIWYPSLLETAEVRRWQAGQGGRARAATIPVYAYADFADDPVDGPGDREGLLFVAGFAHPPNADAALWFVREVLPLVHRALPGVRLWLVGSHPAESVRALAGDQVMVTGQVSEQELARHYARARVAVAPLRFGGGMKGKVVEAMRFALPCVTSPAGAQGLDLPEAHLAVADSAEAFAQAVLQLYTDPARWLLAARGALACARARFSEQALWQAIAPDFEPPPRSTPAGRQATRPGRAPA